MPIELQVTDGNRRPTGGDRVAPVALAGHYSRKPSVVAECRVPGANCRLGRHKLSLFEAERRVVTRIWCREGKGTKWTADRREIKGVQVGLCSLCRRKEGLGLTQSGLKGDPASEGGGGQSTLPDHPPVVARC
jgi:hypothetical protein